MSSFDGGGLRWGVMGCGNISSDFFNAMKMFKNIHFQACAAHSKESAEAFAKTHGFTTSYDSYEALAKDDNVDVVYVGNIHTKHYESIILALEHHKHVLVEKPMCMNAKQVRHVKEVAEKQGKFLMEGMWTRFFPCVRRVRELIKDGAIGNVHFVDGAIGWAFDKNNARAWKRELGGGSLLDIGIYPLAFLTMILGSKPEKISAVGELTEEGIDSYVSATLQYSGSRFGTFQSTFLGNMNDIVTIIGSKGKIIVQSMAHTATEIKVVIDGKESTETFPLPPLAPNATKLNFGNSQGFAYEGAEVTKCILEGKTQSPEYTLEESLDVAIIMDKIRADIGVVYEEDK